MIEVIIVNETIYLSDNNPSLGNAKNRHLKMSNGDIFGLDSIYLTDDTGAQKHLTMVFNSRELAEQFIADGMNSGLFNEEPTIENHGSFIADKDTMCINVVPGQCNDFVAEAINIINNNPDYMAMASDNGMFGNIIVQLCEHVKDNGSHDIAEKMMDMLYGFAAMFDNILGIIGDNITPEAADRVLETLGGMLTDGNEYADDGEDIDDTPDETEPEEESIDI